jgi:hypothetical protein
MRQVFLLKKSPHDHKGKKNILNFKEHSWIVSLFLQPNFIYLLSLKKTCLKLQDKKIYSPIKKNQFLIKKNWLGRNGHEPIGFTLEP